MNFDEQKDLLDELYLIAMDKFAVDHDPLSIPKQFDNKADIEIIGLFAAILAWGNRASTLASCQKLIQIFEQKPYEAILNYDNLLIKQLSGFVHRTFQAVDAVGFVKRISDLYQEGNSLETCFTNGDRNNLLENFYQNFIHHPEILPRTRKHIANPQKGSTGKRLCMYLRWMVRSGYPDFGIWKSIQPNQLYCPLDVHTARVSRALGLVKRKPNNWKTVIELTDQLKQFDAHDPVKYDLALFHAGVTKLL